ncbi:MAG: RNA methyltransferase PUA domain-containing protein, partial [Endozoicomonas sp.]
MRNPRIFSDQLLQASTSIELAGNAANHVGRVLRMKAGEPLVLFNGKGRAWQA